MKELNRRNLGEWACFSLGSNLGPRKDTLEEAMDALESALGKGGLRSAMYESPPLGFESANNFLNCCLAIPSSFEAKKILRLILEIESALGRTRSGGGYADRNIDIDFLLYGVVVLEDADLVLPHPRMHNRRFVLQPLAEILPDLRHPVLGSNIGDLLEQCTDESELRVL